MPILYKILPAPLWRAAEADGQFRGSEVDLRDGFIHFSAASQVAATAARHFRGQPGLVLVAIDAAALGPALRWEPSRGGDLFPHLYAALPVAAATAVADLPLAADGVPRVPELPA